MNEAPPSSSPPPEPPGQSTSSPRAAGGVRPEDRAPLAQKIAYGAGGMTENLANQMTGQMLNPIFNVGLGISPAALGLVSVVFRLWDALTDPVMGNVSDNARTRWGRRRPFIVAGGILTGLTFPLLWQARPEWGSGMALAWLVVTGVIFYTAFTTWSMPYYSLGMEMTPDYHERTRIVAWRTLFAKVVSVIAGWMLALVSLPIFADAATGKPDVVRGMSAVSWGLGILIVCAAVLPGVFVKERYYEKSVRGQNKVPLIKGLKMTLSCRPFLILSAATVLQVVGGSLVCGLGFYLLLYHVCRGDLAQASVIQGWQGMATFIPGLLSVPLWTWIAGRFGKKRALHITLLSAITGSLLQFVCFTPDHPYLAILPSVFMSAFGFAIWMLVPSMQADIADYDELRTGERREGSFSSVFSWSMKLAGTLTAGVSGFILVGTGFDVVKFGANQPPEVLERMRLWYLAAPVLFACAAMALLALYPISRARAEEIRAALEARRGKR